ncbi:MAG: putative selenoprotein [Telmatospirillum sp.]|nr:putative selenoprotein [Telmatospirillum sp.]
MTHHVFESSLAALNRLRHLIAQGAGMMIGLPDYENYRARCRSRNPDAPVMNREEFFRNRQEARYNGKNGIDRCS